MFYLDHVVLAVRDLEAAAVYLRDRFGLGTVEGGDHPEWGTGNLIVPLGNQFIEVAGITDMERAKTNPVGQIFLQKTEDGDKFLAPVLGLRNMTEATEKLGLVWAPGERKTRHGVLGFRSAGIERSLVEGEGWPYFFDYDDDVARLGHGDPQHHHEILGIEKVVVAQDEDKLKTYLSEPVTGLEITDGPPSVVYVQIRTSDGPITLPGRL